VTQDNSKHKPSKYYFSKKCFNCWSSASGWSGLK